MDSRIQDCPGLPYHGVMLFSRAAIECSRDALHVHIGLRPKLRSSPYKDLAEIRNYPEKETGNHGKGKQN